MERPSTHGFSPATQSDAQAILLLMREYYAEDGYPLVAAEGERAVLDLIEHAHLGRLWVARDDSGAVVGYLAVTLGFSLEYRGRDAFIDELYIVERARGQGLGREALRQAEDYCREQRVRALHLEVEPHRKCAQRLYREAGFEDHERHLMTKLLQCPSPGVSS
jgi:ribosomal protein S18 acetylase RimI-like enzyme